MPVVPGLRWLITEAPWQPGQVILFASLYTVSSAMDAQFCYSISIVGDGDPPLNFFMLVPYL